MSEFDQRGHWTDVSRNHDPTCRIVRNRPVRPAAPWRPPVWDDVPRACYEIAGAGVWNPQAGAYAVVRPFGTFAAQVRAAFTQSVAEGIAGALWPDPAGGIRPDSGAGSLTLAQLSLDPRTLADQLMGATAQVAARQAGFPPDVARVIGQAAQQLYAELPNLAAERPAVQYLDFAFSAATGSRAGSSGLQVIPDAHIATVINDLLGPEGITQRDSSRGTFTPLDQGPGGGLGPV